MFNVSQSDFEQSAHQNLFLLNIGFTNLNDTLNGRKNTLAWRIMSEPRDLSEHTDNFNIDKHNLIMSIFQT